MSNNRVEALKEALRKMNGNGKSNSDFDSGRPDGQPQTDQEKTSESSLKKEPQEVTGEKLLSMPEVKIKKLLDPILPKVGVVGLCGGSDTGKSAWLRHLAICVACKMTHFLGFRLHEEYSSAIIAATEDNAEAMKELLTRNKEGLGLMDKDFKSLRFIFGAESLPEKLDKSLTQQPADLVIVDAFADVYDGDMNQTNKIRSCLNKYQKLADKHKCLVIFLHHTGKRTEEGEPSKNNVLGSQGFEAKMRLMIELRTDPQDPDLRHMCITKGNYLPPEYKAESYILRFDRFMLFNNTGERRPYNQLKAQKSSDHSAQQKQENEEIYKMAMARTVQELIKRKMKQREIAQLTGLALGTVNNLSKPNNISLPNFENVHVHGKSQENSCEHEQGDFSFTKENLVLPLDPAVLIHLAKKVLGGFEYRVTDKVISVIQAETGKEVEWAGEVLDQMLQDKVVMTMDDGKSCYLPM